MAKEIEELDGDFRICDTCEHFYSHPSGCGPEKCYASMAEPIDDDCSQMVPAMIDASEAIKRIEGDEITCPAYRKIDLFPKKGDKVRFIAPKTPNPFESKLVSLLNNNEFYIVEQVEIHDWYTNVWLEGIVGNHFNSVWFEVI